MPSSRGSSQPRVEPRSPTVQVDSLQFKLPGKPKNTRVGSLSLPRGNSLPRNQTWVSCIAGTFFTSWATREALRKEQIVLNSFLFFMFLLLLFYFYWSIFGIQYYMLQVYRRHNFKGYAPFIAQYYTIYHWSLLYRIVCTCHPPILILHLPTSHSTLLTTSLFSSHLKSGLWNCYSIARQH